MANHRIINRILLSVFSSLIRPIHECMLRGTHVDRVASAALVSDRTIVDAVRAHAPLDNELTEPRIWIDKNGEVETPCGPGLGMRVRRDVVDRYRV